jgi:molybdenum cofactor cytidylyltransferase
MANVGAVILAAGTASRFRDAGGVEATKLIAKVGAKTLVRSVVDVALASGARPIVVVTGHAEAAVTAELSGCAVTVVHNAHFSSGLASSLQTGISALDATLAAAVILLADMPYIQTALIDRLIDAFKAHPDAAAIVPVFAGRRGNPVLLARVLFDPIALLTGDQGARGLIAAAAPVYEIDADPTIEVDIDTPQNLTPI